MRSTILALLALLFAAPVLTFADGVPGVISDPDGFSNLRSAKSTDSAVVAKVKAGEVFEFNSGEGGAAWMSVTLKNGKTGFLHSSRVRFHATMKELANTFPKDEINEYTKPKGIDYYPMARAAAKGDEKALQTFFGIVGDGAAGETHSQKVCTVIHLLGDEKLAGFVERQSPGMKKKVREALLDGIALAPFKPEQYLKLQFPKSAAALSIR